MTFAAWPASIANAAVARPLLLSFVVASVLTPAVRRLAIALGCYDRPDAGLKPHQRPIPYLGGIALYVGWLAAVIGSCCVHPEYSTTLLFIIAGGSAIMLTGLVDDLVHLRPATRLLVQALIGAALAYGGVGRQLFDHALAPLHSAAPANLWNPMLELIACAVIAIGCLSFVTNATNLIDGLDGLCAGIMAVAAFAYLVLAGVLRGRGALADPGGMLITVLAAAQLGICLAFLCFNFNPASIFMGDSGSLLLGFNVTVILLLVGNCLSMRWSIAAIVVFGFPILDTALAIVRRWMNGRPLFVGDRSHLYDQLRDRGWSVRKTVGVCYALGAGFGSLGLFALLPIPSASLATIYGIVATASAIALRQFGMLRVDDAAERSRRSAKDASVSDSAHGHD